MHIFLLYFKKNTGQVSVQIHKNINIQINKMMLVIMATDGLV